ncbi:MAG: RnfABCDGE type electron transport complex subunit D [Candidatus Omnitrophica bacterium]|nr:RnfABCDGE type electron transport complex subunit D [Candidatus Omnitrophota bacterium]MBU1923346.1 RnfABCDGE type electron transport complex subunit D [Candidatus Omnitrophota bacterium]
MRNNLIVSGSPHVHKQGSVPRIMWTVVFSLIPAGAAGVIIFGLDALWVTLVAVITAVFTEAVFGIWTKKKFTVLDGSAVITGILLAFNLPSNVPLWLPIAGSIFSIVIGKQVFGGLGQNIFNPALVGRVFLMASWPKYMVTFVKPFSFDAVTSATPLAALKEGKILEHLSYLDLFLGKRGGCIGEVCILALLIGAAILLFKGYISWHIPATYIFTTAIFVYIFGAKQLFHGDWLFHILSGGLILGAFFMATDYVATPLTAKGQIIFGVGCGLFTAIIRIWGGYPEGASYAILMMNAATPFIDRYTKSRIYGTK